MKRIVIERMRTPDNDCKISLRVRGFPINAVNPFHGGGVDIFMSEDDIHNISRMIDFLFEHSAEQVSRINDEPIEICKGNFTPQQEPSQPDPVQPVTAPSEVVKAVRDPLLPSEILVGSIYYPARPKPLIWGSHDRKVVDIKTAGGKTLVYWTSDFTMKDRPAVSGIDQFIAWAGGRRDR